MDSAAPWLASWAPLHGDLVGLCKSGINVTQALNQLLAVRAPIELAAGPLRFVDQDELPAGTAYEAFIARTGRVPTRNNMHDLYNGMAWLRFPLAKRRLNELQAAVIARKGVGPTRGPLRDALTLFDENGAWLHAPEVLLDALRQRDWHALFVTRRAEWAQARLTLFGHALLEKLAQPRKGITAHVWCLPAGASPDEEAAVLSEVLGTVDRVRETSGSLARRTWWRVGCPVRLRRSSRSAQASTWNRATHWCSRSTTTSR